MGCFYSMEELHSRRIDKQIDEEKCQSIRTMKILLLGAGESGKSTVLKQMRIIHDDGYDDTERCVFRPVVYGNLIESITAIIRAMEKSEVSFSNEERGEDVRKFLAYSLTGEEHELPEELTTAIKNLLSDENFRATIDRANDFYNNDSSMYYLNQLDRICEQGYIPTTSDVLRTRIRTSGIVETQFVYKERLFIVFDVGGQRSERRKWIHCFDDVRAMIFCVALSEYDMVLLEDENTNRMHESLQLFDYVCNNKYFVKTSIILFLNKKDLFEEKITRSPLTIAFAEYPGPNKFDEASIYIQQQFERLNKRQGPDTDLYIHFTCATDTNNIRCVFDGLTDTIIRNHLREIGLY